MFSFLPILELQYVPMVTPCFNYIIICTLCVVKFTKWSDFMLVACGIAERDGKVLVCKRLAGHPYAGCWEFPSEVLEGDETLESCLERAFFERLSVRLGSVEPMGAQDSVCRESCRIFTFRTKFDEKKTALTGYDYAKWVRFKELRNVRLVPDNVILVKKMENFF